MSGAAGTARRQQSRPNNFAYGAALVETVLYALQQAAAVAFLTTLCIVTLLCAARTFLRFLSVAGGSKRLNIVLLVLSQYILFTNLSHYPKRLSLNQRKLEHVRPSSTWTIPECPARLRIARISSAINSTITTSAGKRSRQPGTGSLSLAHAESRMGASV